MRQIITLILLIFSPFPGILSAQDKPEIFIQFGHTQSVNSAAFSPDGRYVLSGSGDHTIKLWDVSTGREIKTFKGHTLSVNSVAFSPDGKYILSTSDDNTLRLWDSKSGNEIRIFDRLTFSGANTYIIQQIAFSPDGRYVVSGGLARLSRVYMATEKIDTLRLWDTATGKEFKVFKGYESEIYSVAFSPDGRYVLSGGADKMLKLWDITTERIIRTFDGQESDITSVAFSPDGKYVLSGGYSTLKLWDIATGREIRTFRGHSNWVYSAAISPDKKLMLSGSGDNTMKLWDLETGREIKTFQGHKLNVTSVAFSPDGRCVLSASKDTTLKLWDIESGNEIKTLKGDVFKGHTFRIRTVAISPDGRYMLAGGYALTLDGYVAAVEGIDNLKLWDMTTGSEAKTLKGHKYGPNSAVFSPDSKHVLSGGAADYTLKLWDIETAKEIRSLSTGGDILSLSFSPDGKYVLTGEYISAPKLWDISAGSKIRDFDYKEYAKSTVFSPDGKHALLSSGKILMLYDVATGKKIRDFEGHEFSICSMALSPDGKYALSGGCYDNALKLWDVETAREIKTLMKDTDKNTVINVNSIAFSPDGKYALSGNSDATLRLWDMTTKSVIRMFEGHTLPVISVTFSPDGKYALSGSDDSTVRIWEISTGKEVAVMVSFPDKEWIIITHEGYFNASQNGAKYLNVRVGSDVYAIDQFYNKFYRPELVQLALAGKELPKVETFGDIAYKKPAPSVQIISPKSGATIDKDSISMTIRITDNGGGVGDINIYLNGSQVANDTRSVIVKGRESANEKILDFTILLAEGNNEIKVIAFNKEGSMESVPAVISVSSKVALQKPGLYAIVVGINEYKNKSISLSYAVSDAKAFAEILKKSAEPLFENINIKTLTAFNETTKESVGKAFEEIKEKIKSNDLFIFYDASHGLVDVADGEEKYFLLTSNILFLSSTDINKDALSHRELARLIGSIPAQKKLIILDTCNAGKGGREIKIALLQQTRGLTEATAIKLLQREVGSSMFSASSDTQQAIEGYKGHGLFTYVLLEGLKGKADENKNGFVEVHELAKYVKYNVVELSEQVFKRQQIPHIESDVYFPIGKVRQ